MRARAGGTVTRTHEPTATDREHVDDDDRGLHDDEQEGEMHPREHLKLIAIVAGLQRQHEHNLQEKEGKERTDTMLHVRMRSVDPVPLLRWRALRWVALSLTTPNM